MCFTDFDPPSAFQSCQRRARTAHRCYECGATIEAGTLYEYASGVWEGFRRVQS